MGTAAKIAIAAVAGLFVGSKAVENIGEGINEASTGTLKLAIAAGVGVGAFVLLKRFG